MHDTITNKEEAFGYMTIYGMGVMPDGNVRLMKYITGISLFTDIAILRNTALNILEQQLAGAVSIQIVNKDLYTAFREKHPDILERSVINEDYFISNDCAG